jgi:hypothetical protein
MMKRMLKFVVLLLVCVPASCLVVKVSWNLKQPRLSFVGASETGTPSERETITTKVGRTDPQTGKDENKNPIVSFQSYTNTSRWRPSLLTGIFDEYNNKIKNDVGSIFESSFKIIKTQPSSDNALDNIFASIFLTILALPIAITATLLAMPVLMIKHMSFKLILAAAADSCLKALLSVLFVVHHPVSAAQIVVEGIKKMFHRNSNSTAL